MLLDRELLVDFADESMAILEEAEELIAPLEDGEGTPDDIVVAAQKIDGIMGCAKTMGLSGASDLGLLFVNISRLSEGFKFLGYRAGEVKSSQILQVIGGILNEAIELLKTSFVDLKKGYISIDQDAVGRSQERMMWIAKKLNLSEEDEKNLRKRFGMT